MKDALFMLDLDQVLKETKPDDTSESEWELLNIKTCGLIDSCLAKEHRYTFLKETSVYSLWKALENKYMKKSNENWVYLSPSVTFHSGSQFISSSLIGSLLSLIISCTSKHSGRIC